MSAEPRKTRFDPSHEVGFTVYGTTFLVLIFHQLYDLELVAVIMPLGLYINHVHMCHGTSKLGPWSDKNNSFVRKINFIKRSTTELRPVGRNKKS